MLCGVALIAGIFYGTKLLCIYVRKPLVEYCNKRGLSASPWFILICMGIGVYLLNKHLELYNVEKMSELLTSFSYVKSRKEILNCFGGIAFLLLPTLILLIRARKHFIPVLLIKIVCIPLDLFYFVHSAFSNDHLEEGTPIARADYQNSRQYRQTSESQNSQQYSQDSGYQNGYIEGDSSNTSACVEEKYNDQYRVSQEADSYHTVSSNGGKNYYTGDYVPFISEGDTTEVQSYDSDYTPME